MTRITFAPGEVTPEQLEQYRMRYEAARQEERQAYERYEATYWAWCDTLSPLKEAESVYTWAKHGMVKVTA